jgi:hypothetical protein
MKKLVITLIIALLTVAGITARAEAYPEEYLGLPGDNLNLYAVMKLFQESETLEEFERSLNNPNSRINNLDLNGDNMVDYLMVFDYVDGDVHNIVIRTAINANENQDIAVFTVQRFLNGSVQIQLVGDEALYGRNYIIEPIYADNLNETPNPGYTGGVRTRSNVTVVHTSTYEIATWPLIRFIYLPGYVTWRSSWYWGYRPHYWNPWRPYYWHVYYGYHSHWHNHYYAHYRHWNHHRYSRYNDFYYRGIRAYSPKIKIKIKEGRYRSTYSRPDLRSRGSELYAMDTRNSKTGRAINSNNGVRRSQSQSVRPATKNGTGAVNQRRTTTGVTRKAATRSTVNRGTVNSRRSSTTINNRASAPANNKGTRTVRKSTVNSGRSNANTSTVTRRSGTVNSNRPVTSVNKKSSSNYSVKRNTGATRRSSGSVTGRTANRPSVGRATVKSGSTRSSVTRRSPASSSVRKSTSISHKSARSQPSRVSSRQSTSRSTRSSVNRGGSSQRRSQSRSSRR